MLRKRLQKLKPAETPAEEAKADATETPTEEAKADATETPAEEAKADASETPAEEAKVDATETPAEEAKSNDELTKTPTEGNNTAFNATADTNETNKVNDPELEKIKNIEEKVYKNY